MSHERTEGKGTVGVDDPVAVYSCDDAACAVIRPLVYAKDHLNSVEAIYDVNYQLLENYDYSSYGVINNNENITQNIYGFISRSFNFYSNNMRKRDYMPYIGKFMQVDPLGFFDSSNLYSYSLNNPVNYFDPIGLFCIPIWSRKGPWEDVEILKTYLDIQAHFSQLTGPVGFCLWRKVEVIIQKRNIIKRKFCCNKINICRFTFHCGIVEGEMKVKFRTFNRIKNVYKTRGLRWASGGDIENGDAICCQNPFTGRPYCQQI